MKSKILIYILSGALGLTVMVGAFFNLKKTIGVDLESNIELSADGVIEKEMSIVGLDLIPGISKQYVINLLADDASSYDISLNFKKKGVDSLKEYIHVRVTVGEVTVDKTLAELFEKGLNFTDANADKIYITYLMPESVGNEAQGKEISFNIKLTVVKCYKKGID